MLKKIIDQAVFHICNSGMILSIEHDLNLKEDESSNLVYSIPHLGVEMRAFGIPMSMKIPLGSPEIVWWLNHVTGKLLNTMISKHGQGRHFSFRGHNGRITIEDGKECDRLFKAPTPSVPVSIWKNVEEDKIEYSSCKPDSTYKIDQIIESAIDEIGSYDKITEEIRISLLAFGDQCKRQFIESITEEELRSAHNYLMSNNGTFAEVLKAMSSVPADRKREIGIMINAVRGEIEIMFESRLREIHGLCK